MITEDFVSSEVARLLEQKGFDEPCDYVYDGEDRKWIHHLFIFTKPFNECAINSKLKSNGYVTAPTINVAMKWLRKVHKLHITTKPYITTEGIMYVFEIYKLESDKFTLLKSKAGFESPEECANNAVKYVLENLI